MVLITFLERVNEYFKCISLENIFRKFYDKKEKRKNDFFLTIFLMNMVLKLSQNGPLKNILRKYQKKKNKQTNKCPKGTLFSFGPFPYMSYIDGVIWFVTVDTWSECCALLVQPMLSLDLLPSKANFAMLSLSL